MNVTKAGPQLGLLMLGLLSESASGVVLTRGPYLQAPTTNSVLVRWRTDEPVETRLRYGLRPQALEFELTSEDLNTEHAVLATGLKAGTRYYYAAGTVYEDLAGGPDCYFTTAPSTERSVRVWVTGDTRATNYFSEGDSRQAVRDAYLAFTGDRPTDLWLHTGDLADMGMDEELQEAFFDVYAGPLRRMAVYPTVGNHDLGTAGGRPYLDAFTLPAGGEAGGVASGSERYYSFNYANIHFVVVDVYGSTFPDFAFLDPGSIEEQVEWLWQDLAANTQQWLIAMFHSPPYTHGSHNSDWEWDSVAARTYFVPVLEACGVDLVLNGHSHNYERSYLIQGHYGPSTSFAEEMKLNGGDGRADGDGPYYKPDSHSGAVYCVVGSSGFLGYGGFGHPAMFYSANALGSLVLDIQGDALLAWFLRDTGAIEDHFVIVKGSQPPAARLSSIRTRYGLVHLEWEAVPGLRYQVHRRSGLSAPAVPASPELEAWSNPMYWSEPFAWDQPGCYYEVRTLP